MADFKNIENCNDSVCIDAGRVYDSCCDRDCLEDLRCFFLPETQTLINNALSVRLRGAEVLNVFIDVEPVNFNKGYYSCDLTFFFLLSFDLYTSPSSCPQVIHGIATFNKKVILYGGDCNANVFRSNGDFADFCAYPEPCKKEKVVPTAVVEVVEPIVLGVKILEDKRLCCCCCCACDIPDTVSENLHGNLPYDDDRGKYLVVSLGIFSIVRIVRPGQYLINATEYIIPDKECISPSNDDPCSVFKTMAFPISEFGCTPAITHFEKNKEGKCGCGG
jgi:hypothetical protein